MRPRRALHALGAVTAFLLVWVFGSALGEGSTPSSAAASDPVLAAAGDIACDPSRLAGMANCHMFDTAPLLAGADGVLPLGDTQYRDGSLAKFNKSYDKSWGAYLPITYPVVGNHEYNTPGAAGYFSYFGAAAHGPGGYYSFNLGAWHVIVLNGNCGSRASGGCGSGSPQWNWLQSDLAGDSATCTLAAWHQPRFSSGMFGSVKIYGAFWRLLYQYHADVVLNGHDHVYERFAPQTPKAIPSQSGIREFVVGTGGVGHQTFTTIAPNSEVRDDSSFGVLDLTLHPTSYSWNFVSASPSTFSDTGDSPCVA